MLVEAELPDVAALDDAIGFAVALYEVRPGLDRYLREQGLALRFNDLAAGAASPDVRGILASVLDPATAVSEAAYRAALAQHRPRLIEGYRRYFASHRVDAMVFPTTPLPAPPIGDDATTMLNGRAAPTFLTVTRNCGPSSNAGLPGISVPVGLTAAGLPVGLGIRWPRGRRPPAACAGAGRGKSLPAARRAAHRGGLIGAAVPPVTRHSRFATGSGGPGPAGRTGADIIC